MPKTLGGMAMWAIAAVVTVFVGNAILNRIKRRVAIVAVLDGSAAPAA